MGKDLNSKDLNSSQIKKSITQYADAIASKKTSNLADSTDRKGGVVSLGKKEGGVANRKAKEDGSALRNEEEETPEMQQKIQRILASQWDSRYGLA